MDFSNLNTSTKTPAPDADMLYRGKMKPAKGSQHDRLVAQTEKWVATSFYGVLLKQMRESPFKSDLFSGGRGGEAFGSMYDQQMAENMSRGAGKKLVNAIVRKIEARTAYAAQKRSADAKSTDQTDAANAPRKVEASPAPDSSPANRNVRSADVAPVR